MNQVATQTTAQMAITAGVNIDRMTSEAAFAKLAGVTPLRAFSAKTNRHRLNRAGDRQANSALYLIITGRMKNHPEIIRCLKRHLARSIYRALSTDS